MTGRKMLIRAQLEDYQQRIGIAIFEEGLDGGYTAQAVNVIMEDMDPHEMFGLKKVVAIGPDEAQVLMDDLWRSGIRPTEGRGSVGQLAAVRSHLEDMRKIVFEKYLRWKVEETESHKAKPRGPAGSEPRR